MVLSPQSELPILEWVRNETRELHQRAEQNEFQASLVRGTLPLDAYVQHLEQMYLLHQALEPALQAIEAQQKFQPWPMDRDAYLLDRLIADLADFQRDSTTLVPLPTLELLRITLTTPANHPEFLLGVHYVLQGSLNGARYFVPRVRQCYELTEATGTRYLDPYGVEQPARWAEYKQRFNSIPLNQSQRHAVLHGAQWMFLGTMLIGRELMCSLSTPAGQLSI